MSSRSAAGWGALLGAALFVATSAPAARAETTPPAVASPATSDARDVLVMLRLSPEHYRPGAAYGGSYGDRFSRSARKRLAESIARQYGLSLVGDGWPMPLVGLDCYVMRVPPSQTVDVAVAQVSHDPRVAWSEPLRIYRTQGAEERENDPLFRVQPAARAWRLADLHKVATGKGVKVAVVDSKIEIDHPDLAGQFVADQDFVAGRPSAPERHGTGVAGVIAAKAGNRMGIAGIAPGARLMALRACWQTDNGSAASPTLCDSLSLAKALHFAIDHRAEVINLSLTGPQDRLLTELIATANARRITVVAAFDPGLPKGGFPASEPGVIAVAAESLATVPPGVYSAPDRDVPTTQPGDKWNLVNGSSYAAAHVSGLIALVREGRASGSPLLLVASQPQGGVVDAYATILRKADRCAVASCGLPPRGFQASAR
jgi:hypothetical protein